MKYIANILTEEPFDNNGLYNVVNSFDQLITHIPTLIIGWEKTKQKFPDASIIDWSVSQNIYWTYGKYERRDKYEANVKKFQELAFKKFVESIDYVFYDVIVCGEVKLNQFIESISSETNKTVYSSRSMLYVYYGGTNKVVGISLRDCDYISEDINKKIFSAIYKSKTVTILKNTDNVSKEIRYRVADRTYLLPYLYS